MSDLSGGSQPTRVGDLAGNTDQRTVVADLSGRPPTTTRPTVPGAQVMTVAPGSDVQDAIPTHLSDPARPRPGTDVTDLHVAGGKPVSAEGTHLGEIWGDFHFDRLLGRGGMGAVYLGRQISLDRQVAIKVLPSHLSANEQFRERFQLEAKAVAKMSSPHVVQVFAAGIFKGHHYFAMEYVEGEDLSRKLRTGLKPSYRQALDLVTQAARGLAAAGEHGIVHRDIKPGNMMIDRKGTLKLMDFGLVRLASAGHSLTMAGTVMGTVSYFSPEQGRGEACDQRTDLYALGVVFYELLTGRLPFTGENATSVIYQHIHTSPRLPRELDPNIPEDYQAVVLKCLQKVATDRYADAAEMIADLERLAAGQPPAVALARPDLLVSGATIVGSGRFAPSASTAATMPQAAPAPRGRGLVVAVAAGVVAVAGAGTWLALRGGDRPRPEPPPVVAEPTPSKPPVAPVVDPDLKATLNDLVNRQNQDAARAKVIAEAQGLLADGEYAKAEQLLDTVAKQSPGDAQVESALRQVRAAREQAGRLTAAVDAQLAAGDAALARGDLAVARQAYTAARQIDPRDARVAGKLAEVDRRAAEAPVVQPAQPGPQVAPPAQGESRHGEAAMAQARAAIERGDLPEARRIVNVNRGLNADDPQWAALAKALDAGEGKSLLREAQQAFARGNVELAGKAAAQAQGLIPDDAELKTLLKSIEQLEGELKQRDRTIAEADNLLTEGKAAKAEQMLADLAAKRPDDVAVSNALRRARAERERAEARQRAVDAQLDGGDAALARADLDAAQLAFTAARQLDPTSERAAAGLDKVKSRKDAVEAARLKVDAAVREGRLADAESALADLKRIAPGSAQAVLAESQLNAAKVKDAEDRRRAEELERQRQAQAKAVAALVDDAARPVAELEAAVAAFRKDAGDARPELPDLERRLEDRRSRDQIAALLGGIDKAVAAKAEAAKAVAPLVGDAEYARALGEFAAMPGATLAHRLGGMTRTGDSAVAEVAVATAMAESPEEILPMRYELTRTGGVWRVMRALPAASAKP